MTKPLSRVSLLKFLMNSEAKVLFDALERRIFRAERIAEANRYAEIHGKEKFCASQIKWGLAITSPGAEYDDTIQEMNESHYRFHCETKLPLFAYSSQAKGFFSKLHIDDNGEAFMEQGKCRDRYFCRENIEIYRRLLEKAERKRQKRGGACAKITA